MYKTEKLRYATAISYLFIALYNVYYLIMVLINDASMFSFLYQHIFRIVLALLIAFNVFKCQSGFSLSLSTFLYGSSILIPSFSMMSVEYLNSIFTAGDDLSYILLQLSSIISSTLPQLLYFALALLCFDKNKSSKFLKSIFKFSIAVSILSDISIIVNMLLQQIHTIAPVNFAENAIMAVVGVVAPILFYSWLMAGDVYEPKSRREKTADPIPTVASAHADTAAPTVVEAPVATESTDPEVEEDPTSGSKNI